MVATPDHEKGGSKRSSAILEGLGSLRVSQGRLKEAAEVFSTSLAKRLRQAGEDDPRVVKLQSNLAQVYLLDGRINDAEPLLRESTARQRATLPARSVDRILSTSSLG